MPAKAPSKAHLKKLDQQYNVMAALKHLKEIAAGKYPESSPEARELELWQENTEPLYRQQQYIDRNLAKKIVAGKFNFALSVKLWRYLADAAAQSYTKENGSGHGSSFGIFTTAHRDQLARRLAHDFAVRVSVPGFGDIDDEARKILEKPSRG